RGGPNRAGEPIGSPSCSTSRTAIGCRARISVTRPSVGAERRLPRLVLRLQGRFEEHGADAAVGPRPAWFAHADVWIGGWLVEPGAGHRVLAAAPQEGNQPLEAVWLPAARLVHPSDRSRRPLRARPLQPC